MTTRFSRTEWTCIAFAVIAEIAFAALNLSTMPVYLTEGRGLPDRWVGIALGAFLLSETLFKGWFGAWSDRVGTAVPIRIGAGIAATSAAVTLVIPTFDGLPFVLVLLRFVDGIAAAMIWPSIFAWASRLADSETARTRILSAVNACYFVGIALAFPVAGIANDFFRFRGAGIVLSLVLFLIVLLSTRAHQGDRDRTEFAPSDSDQLPGVGVSARLVPYLVLGFVVFMAIGFPSFIIKLLPMRVFGMSESAVGAVMLPAAVSLAVLSGPVTKVGERIGNRRAVHLGLLSCVSGAGVLGAAQFFPEVRTVPILVGSAVPLGLGFLLAMPAWYASVTELNPTEKGRNLGAVMTAQGIGAMIAGPIGAWLFELNPFTPFVATLGTLLLGLALSLVVVRPAR